MSGATDHSIQEILNSSVDDAVEAPLICIGMMVWNGSAWVRWQP